MPSATFGDPWARSVCPELEYAAPPVSCDDARSLARSIYAVNVEKVKPLPGERDRNFWIKDDTGTEFALRVVHPAEDPAVTAFQTLAMLHAAADPDLLVPHVLSPAHADVEDVVWCAPGTPPRRVRCVTYLHGVPLYRTAPTTTQRGNVGAFLARLDRALADFRHRGEDHPLLWDLKRADRALALVPMVRDAGQRELLERILTRFADRVQPQLCALRHQTVHNDFNPHNILVHPSENNEIAGVFDFGDMVRGPLIQDLATASAYQVSDEGHPLLGPAQVGSRFHAVYPLSKPEIELLPDLIVSRLALAGAISSWRAVRHPENAKYILRNAATVWRSLRRLETLCSEDGAAWLHQRITQGEANGGSAIP